MSSYKNFELGLTNVVNEIPKVVKASSKAAIKLWRCSSPEAEARQAIEQIRKWVRDGVKPESICIASQRISDYEDIFGPRS